MKPFDLIHRSSSSNVLSPPPPRSTPDLALPSFNRFCRIAIVLLALVLLVLPAAVQPQQEDAVPGPISNLSLSAKAKRITVSWNAPNSGGAVDNYIVHISPQNGGKGDTKRPKAGKTSVTFKKLKSGVEYRVFVRGKNSVGKGERVYGRITTPREQQLRGGSADPTPTPRATYAPWFLCLGEDGAKFNLPGVCLCQGEPCIATFTPTPVPNS